VFNSRRKQRWVDDSSGSSSCSGSDSEPNSPSKSTSSGDSSPDVSPTKKTTVSSMLFNSSSSGRYHRIQGMMDPAQLILPTPPRSPSQHDAIDSSIPEPLLDDLLGLLQDQDKHHKGDGTSSSGSSSSSRSSSSAILDDEDMFSSSSTCLITPKIEVDSFSIRDEMEFKMEGAACVDGEEEDEFCAKINSNNDNSTVEVKSSSGSIVSSHHQPGMLTELASPSSMSAGVSDFDSSSLFDMTFENTAAMSFESSFGIMVNSSSSPAIIKEDEDSLHKQLMSSCGDCKLYFLIIDRRVLFLVRLLGSDVVVGKARTVCYS